MKKTILTERFQQLAGIKSLSGNKLKEDEEILKLQEVSEEEKITNHITYQGDGPVNKPTAVSRAFELYKHGSNEDIIIGVLIDVLEEIDRDGDIESNEY